MYTSDANSFSICDLYYLHNYFTLWFQSKDFKVSLGASYSDILDNMLYHYLDHSHDSRVCVTEMNSDLYPSTHWQLGSISQKFLARKCLDAYGWMECINRSKSWFYFLEKKKPNAVLIHHYPCLGTTPRAYTLFFPALRIHSCAMYVCLERSMLYQLRLWRSHADDEEEQILRGDKY